MTDERRNDGASLSDLRNLRNQMPRWVLSLLALGVAAIILSRITTLLVMLIAAAVIAYILSSVISALERLGIKRSVAVILLFVLAAIIALAADLIFLPHLKQGSVNAYTRFSEFSHQIQDALLLTAQSSAYPFIESGIMKLVHNVFDPGGFLERTLNGSEIFMQATPFIVALIFVPFFVFFLLKDWPGVMKRVIDWIPPSHVETTISVIDEINTIAGKYLRGLAADCFVIGVLASAGLWLAGINYPVMLGVLSGVANIIPYFGPIIGCTVASLVALMQYHSVDPILNVVVLFLIIKFTDDLVIQPLTIGKGVHLHPVPLVITLIVGEKLFGVMGMLLGSPVVIIAWKTAGILIEHRQETQRMESAGSLVKQHIAKYPFRPI